MVHSIKFQELKDILTQGFAQPLPGATAQQQMAPIGRKAQQLEELDDELVRKAAVLALFYEKDHHPHLVLTERVVSEDVHSGQISLPGGKREPQDADFRETALRETYEEVGLLPDNINVLGPLTPLYIPPSNFLVHPFVGFYNTQPYFEKQVSEVNRIISINFNEFLNSHAISNERVQARNFSIEVPVFKIENLVIWGATAMMLSELRALTLNQLS